MSPVVGSHHLLFRETFIVWRFRQAALVVAVASRPTDYSVIEPSSTRSRSCNVEHL